MANGLHIKSQKIVCRPLNKYSTCVWNFNERWLPITLRFLSVTAITTMLRGRSISCPFQNTINVWKEVYYKTLQRNCPQSKRQIMSIKHNRVAKICYWFLRQQSQYCRHLWPCLYKRLADDKTDIPFPDTPTGDIGQFAVYGLITMFLLFFVMEIQGEATDIFVTF